MARNRTQGWYRAFDKSFALQRQQEQREREQEQLRSTTYTIYVGNNLVHRCANWHEAHATYIGIHGIEEWSSLPIYVAINGEPKWGTMPKELEEPTVARRFKSNRTRYLHKCGKSEQECEKIAQNKLAQIITTKDERDVQSNHDHRSSAC